AFRSSPPRNAGFRPRRKASHALAIASRDDPHAEFAKRLTQAAHEAALDQNSSRRREQDHPKAKGAMPSDASREHCRKSICVLNDRSASEQRLRPLDYAQAT